MKPIDLFYQQFPQPIHTYQHPFRDELLEIFNYSGEINRICRSKLKTIRKTRVDAFFARERLKTKRSKLLESQRWFIDYLMAYYAKLLKKMDSRFFFWQRKLDVLEGNFPKYKFYDIEEIKRIPIENIINIKPALRSPDRLHYSCIFHNEKNPSMVVYQKTNSYYCFGCGAYGSVIDIVMQQESCDFKEAVNLLN